MKAIHYSTNGGPEVMQYGDLPDVEAGPDGVVIAVEWISIEGGDLLNRLVTPPPHTPFIPGYQASGTIVAVGERVHRFKTGDRVVGFNWSGSHAALFACPEHYVFLVPDAVDLRAAATIPVAFGTAHDALFEYGQLKRGETVLIQGAAGGVGLAAVQFAAQAGAIVIGTASSHERLERIRPYGLHHGIDYRTEDIAARVAEITGGRGVDLVIDLAGGAGKDALVKSLRHHGRYAVVGASSGSLPSFGFFEMIRKAMLAFGISFGRDMHTERAHSLLATIMTAVADGDIDIPIDREFLLSEAVQAHDYVANAHPLGRVVMKVAA